MLQFMDSCDHYDTDAAMLLKWNNAFGATHTSPNGRNGRGIQMSGSGAYISKSLTYQSGWVCGWAVNITAIAGAFGIDFYYQALHAGESTLFSACAEQDGSVSLYAGTRSGPLIGNSGSNGFFLKAEVWYWFEVKYSFSGSSNIAVTAELRVNTQPWVNPGSPVNSGINVNTLLLGIAETNVHQFGSPTTVIIDDIVVADQSGTGSLNDFPGDTALGVVFPASDVSGNLWTGVGGSGGLYTYVNDIYPEINDDTKYIESQTPTDVANFGWQPISVPSGGSVVGIHYGVYARKDAEGGRSFKQFTGPSGSPTSSGPVWFPGDSYAYYFWPMDEDPTTSMPWTQAGFNATDFGVDLVS